jgi:CRP-like cAMP-binding protein
MCAGSMLFDKLTSQTMQKVFLSLNPLEVLPKTVIIQQGDAEASKFYVLESGACEARACSLRCSFWQRHATSLCLL